MIDLTKTLVDRTNNRTYKRNIERFSISDCWAIVNGYKDIDTYLNGEQFDFISAFRMWEGVHTHNQVQELLVEMGWEVEKKFEKKFGYEWTLVGKVDAVNLSLEEGSILEIKTSKEVMEKAKKWHEHQCKMYCTLLEKPSALVVQPVYTDNQLYLKELACVKRNDAWFMKQMDKINEFYLQLKERTKTNG